MFEAVLVLDTDMDCILSYEGCSKTYFNMYVKVLGEEIDDILNKIYAFLEKITVTELTVYSVGKKRSMQLVIQDLMNAVTKKYHRYTSGGNINGNYGVAYYDFEL